MRVAVLLVVWWLPLVARADELGSAVQTGDWAAASRLAAVAADPVAARVVRFVRALTPGAMAASEILEFMVGEPGWPLPGVLARRYSDALAGERDAAVARVLCRRRAPGTVPALLRCAVAGPQGEVFARQAWVVGITDAAEEGAFIKRWGASIGPEVQVARFDRLAWSETAAPGGALARQAVRLEPAMRSMAEARLALMRGDAAGPGLFGLLPAVVQADPGLVLDLLRWFRRADRDAEASRAWAERGEAAELAAPAERRAAFWSERNVLARRLLRAGENQAAFAVAGSEPWPNGDALFLTGWIALRRLGQPGVAAERFRGLAAGSGAAITQGRAGYWLGRALREAGDPVGSQEAFQAGARWVTTYYGQLSALAGGEAMEALERRIGAMDDPSWDEAEALRFAGTDMARAAALLVAWGLRNRAKAFLPVLESDVAGRAVPARFAAALGLPDQAVALARLAGRDGVMLPRVGWPEMEVPAGPVAAPVVLGLIRQESSFDAAIRSPVGATGLMQLMPATAAAVAKGLGEAAGPLTDPALNMRLGSAYLAAQVERFGALPPALAAYNAGPNRARDWLAVNGDPASGAADPIDWVELIPFEETRNYVQRIVENVLIYRARAGVALPHPVLGWGGSGI